MTIKFQANLNALSNYRVLIVAFVLAGMSLFLLSRYQKHVTTSDVAKLRSTLENCVTIEVQVETSPNKWESVFQTDSPKEIRMLNEAVVLKQPLSQTLCGCNGGPKVKLKDRYGEEHSIVFHHGKHISMPDWHGIVELSDARRIDYWFLKRKMPPVDRVWGFWCLTAPTPIADDLLSIPASINCNALKLKLDAAMKNTNEQIFALLFWHGRSSDRSENPYQLISLALIESIPVDSLVEAIDQGHSDSGIARGVLLFLYESKSESTAEICSRLNPQTRAYLKHSLIQFTKEKREKIELMLDQD